MRRSRFAIWIAALVLVFVIGSLFFSTGIGTIVDWLWFSQLGYREIFSTILGTEFGLGIFGAGIFLLLTGLTFVIARGVSRRSHYLTVIHRFEIPGSEQFSEKLPPVFRGLVWVGIIFLAWIVAQWSATHWNGYLFAMHGVPIAEKDPVLGISLAFYLFRLPFIFFIYHLLLVAIIASLLIAAVAYLIEGGIWAAPQGIGVGRNARCHLMFLGGLLFLLFAWRARLGMYDLVYAPGGLVFGAGYADIHVGWPVLWILFAFCILAAAAFFLGTWNGNIRPAKYAVGALIVVAILGGLVAPAIEQNYVVAPSELEKELPYISRNIAFTRKAYGLDKFDQRNFPDIQDLTPQSIQQNAATMRNLRLWDQDAQLTTFQQLQEIRTYYDFSSVYYDRYTIDSQLRQVSLSARELSASSLPDPNWVNQHLIYTHGYGLCMGPVNESTSDGLPMLFIKDIPPASSISLKVTRPQIYYGQLSNDYCLVKTGAKEFDYPSGDDNVYTTYQGAGGVPVGGFWRRLLFALNFSSANILFSGYIQPNSRIMLYRQISQRVQKLAPFLSFDSHPYMVVANDGSLQWIVDAYTTSAQYPYSDPTDGIGNYIRNSVKIVINAYNGNVTFYVADPSDPLIQTYERIFPGVFHPLSDMSSDLRSHIRYPQDIFAIQAAKYAVYHMTDPSVFYSKEDLWRVATRTVNGASTAMNPYYAVMKLPEVGKTEEFILMLPFTPARKNNMIAWMAARCDGPDYGKVLVFTFPKDKLIYGPEQIQSRVNQSPTISQQLTLWDQGGSRVTRGTLLVVPVQNAVMYVEPLYLEAQSSSSIPELKRVIVAYSDHVAMEPTLGDALTTIFGGQAGQTEQASSASAAGPATSSPATTSPATAISSALKNLIDQANQQFQDAQQRLRNGDWAGYGQAMQQLGQLLKQMPAQTNTTPAKPPSATAQPHSPASSKGIKSK